MALTSERIDMNAMHGTMFQKSVIVETWRVWDPAANTVMPYSVRDALSLSLIPQVGEAFPAPLSGSPLWEQTALCRSLQASQMQNHMDVVATFDTYYFYTDDAKKNTAGTVASAAAGNYLPARTIASISTKEISIYRNGWSTSPPIGSDSTADIGGTVVISYPQPIRISVPSLKLRVVLLIDAEVQDPIDAADKITSFIGKRNSDTFLTVAAGGLVCVGGGVSHLENEYFEASVEYEWDGYYEHVQVAETASDGRPKGNASGGSVVKWQRPTRSTAAFNDLWGATEQGGVWRYMAENGRYYA
jgi:hypothetical protein